MLRSLNRLFTPFHKDSSGNVAIMFAAIILPLLAASGLAIDMYRLHGYRAEIREAADAGVLAAARAKTLDPSITTEEMKTIARTHMEANLESSDQFIIKSFKLSYDTETGDTDLDIETTADTLLLGLVGKEDHTFRTRPSARVAPPKKLEIVLVLDNTYSMVGDKLDSLKDAASDLVTTVMTERTENENVQIGVVPFSQYVNIGKSRRSSSWLDVPADYSETKNECRNTYPDRVRSGCRTVSNGCSSTKDGVKSFRNCTKCDSDVRGQAVQVCEDVTRDYEWHGCVGSRQSPFNVKDTSYGTHQVPGLLNRYCAGEILPLTDDRRDVISTLDDMAVEGSETFIAPGLTWGYRLLSPATPFTAEIDYSEVQDGTAVKAIVLMTDGANTVTADGDDHQDDDVDDSNELLEDVCDEVKDQDIVIYTIAFEVTDSSVQNLLRECATDASHFFDAQNADALSEAFGTIGLSLTDLALTK